MPVPPPPSTSDQVVHVAAALSQGERGRNPKPSPPPREGASDAGKDFKNIAKPKPRAPPKAPPRAPPKASGRKPPPPPAPPRPPGSSGSARSGASAAKKGIVTRLKGKQKPKPPPPSTGAKKPPPKPPSVKSSTKVRPPPPPNPPKSVGGSSSAGSVSTGGGGSRGSLSREGGGGGGGSKSAPVLARNASSNTPPPSNPKLQHSTTSSMMKKRLSGADIVRDDLRRQLREIQSTNNQLAHRKRYLEKRCETFTEKIAKLRAPSESTQKAKKLTDAALKRVNELSDKLKAAGVTDVSDATLSRRCTELEEHKKKLKRLKEDKAFLVKAIIELMGGGAPMTNLLEEAKNKEVFSSPKVGRKGGLGREDVEGLNLKHGEYASMYQHGKWNFAHPVNTGTGKRIVIMSPAEKKKREDEAEKYREWCEEQMKSKMPTWMEDEREWGMLKKGYDAVNFFSNSASKRKGVHVKKVQYTPRKQLFAAQVATNRTPKQQVMTKAAGLIVLPDKDKRIDKQGGVVKRTDAEEAGGEEGVAGGTGNAIFTSTMDTISPEVRKKLGLFEFEDYKEEMQRARKKDGANYRSWKRGYESQHNQIVSSLRGQLAQIDVAAGMARDEILHLGAL
mmetsp:Transcript_21428/g.44641  ORF Transcript_21428/g.44641 Transcript_21428/m.44641 type:complete len:618 (+) Transcript_21428:191-2044(+)